MKVKKHNLLLIASFVWIIAGFNVLNIGIKTYKNYLTITNLIISLLIFSFFLFMIFSKLVTKHTNRIKLFKEEFVFFLNFFDKKSFIIMFCMITFGVLLRNLHLVPDVFIAVFYSGLGFALFFSGILFGYNYFKYLKTTNFIKEVISMKKLINLSFIYFILAMVCGVFYREFTKFFNFTGKTTLAFTHTHLLILGTILFLILALFSINTDLLEHKNFKTFLKLYNIALPLMIIMMIIRGILQILNTQIINSVNVSISGFAGISHILMLISLILLFLVLKNLNVKK